MAINYDVEYPKLQRKCAELEATLNKFNQPCKKHPYLFSTSEIRCPECQLDAVRGFIQQNDDWKMTTKDVVKNIKQYSEKGWEKYRELRKEVAKDKYPSLTNDVILDIPQHLRRDAVTDEVQAMLNAANVMDAQSALITKLESKLKDRDMLYEAGITAAKEEIAELQGVIEKLREVVPKLVEVVEGGISTTSTQGRE